MWSTSAPSKPSVRAKSNSLSKCPVFPTNILFFNFFLWSKSDDVAVRRRLDTFKVRLQGAEGVTSYEHHDHEERKRHPCRIRTITWTSQQS